MHYVTVSAPKGHGWDGARTNICERRDGVICTSIGTFILRDGVWRHCCDDRVTINTE